MKYIFKFPKLEAQNKIIHGFSTKYYGDMSSNNTESRRNLKNFGLDLGIDPLNIVEMEQVHSNNVEWVTGENRGWKMLQTDGLITKEAGVNLVVKCADCFPVFIMDKKMTVVSAIHAGWRGVYEEIVNKTIKEIVQGGISTSDLTAYIGPGIRKCCYDVAVDRAEKFKVKFKNSEKFVIETEGKTYISLPEIIKKQLTNCGLSLKEIDDCEICTNDNEEFYSYRREENGSGRFAGLIGLL